MLRIIAGERRGHKIEGPREHRHTRPTSDLVRESIFNILGASVQGIEVVDLFAGTGALGLEALSRGASHATFVEKQRENASLIARNLATLRYEGRGTILTANAYSWPESFHSPEGRPLLVLLDPPYRDYEGRGARKIYLLLDALRNLLPPGSLIVAEAGRVANESVLPDLPRWDIRRYGNTHVAVYEIPSPVLDPTPHLPAPQPDTATPPS